MVGFAWNTVVYVGPIINHYRHEKACLLCEHKAINIDSFERQCIWDALQIKQSESPIWNVGTTGDDFKHRSSSNTPK